MRYLEQVKEVLNENMEHHNLTGEVKKELLKDPVFEELYIIQFRFIHDCYRSLLSTFVGSVNDQYFRTSDTRMAAFIGFMVAICLSYLVLWTPFVNKLSKEIWKTKSLLTIIPIEVILKISSIQEFLNNDLTFNQKTANP